MRICTVITCAWVGLATMSPVPAQAQSAGSVPVDERTSERVQGWSVRPALDYALLWDSNVLIQNAGEHNIRDNIIGETVHLFRPRGVLDFIGRRGEFGLRYEGAFSRHANLASLNSFEQRLMISGRRQITRRTVFFAAHDAAVSPTTQLTELVGVPFGRIGSRLLHARTGVERALGKKTQAIASYRFQHVHFEQDAELLPTVLYGGRAHGATLSLKHVLRARTAFTADYDIDNAKVVNGEAFGLQVVWAGAEHSLSDALMVSGSAGVARLGTNATSESQLGPTVRLGLVRTTPTSALGLRYARSFVPSYGFGGTTHNEELAAHMRLPIARRLSTFSTFAWRRNEPLVATQLSLRSLWFHGGIAYAIFEGIQLEGFSTATHQTIDRPGGRVGRYQFGIQVTAGRTVRIR